LIPHRSSALLAIVVFQPLWAEEPAKDAKIEARKDSIVVTGTYEPAPLEEVNRSVTVQQIRGETLLYSTVIDALRLNPSVDVRQRGTNGIQADVSIRGGSFGQTLVLLNGRRMNDAQSGHHNMDLPVPLESVERVEVLSGAGSTMYGSDAVGGVVNLVTAPPKRGEIRVQTGVGNFGTNQQRASMTGVLGSLSQQLSFSRDFSTGFIENRDYRNLMFGSGTQWKSKLGMTGVDLGYADKPFGAQGFYGRFPSWERTKTWYAGVRQSLGDRTTAEFSYRRHTDIFVLRRYRPQDYMNHHISESWQGSLRRREELGKNATLHYGGEGFGDSIDSTNLGVHDRARGAAYANLDLRLLDRVTVSAGVRDEVVKGMPGEISPSFAIGYWASSKVKLRGGASRAFRLPTFTDLYYRDPANLGNPSLRPERAWSYEAGADYRPSPSWRMQATMFHRRDTDGIDFTRPAAGGVWFAMNVQRLRFTGVESSVSKTWRRSVFDFSYTGLRADRDPLPGLQSKYAFNYLTHSGLLGWTGQLPGQVSMRTRIGAMERRGGKAYANWDVMASRAVGAVRPYVQFTNITNAYWEDIPGVANPGRAFVVGLEFVYPGGR
jgi:iron complex outermembrane receptor protein